MVVLGYWALISSFIALLFTLFILNKSAERLDQSDQNGELPEGSEKAVKIIFALIATFTVFVAATPFIYIFLTIF